MKTNIIKCLTFLFLPVSISFMGCSDSTEFDTDLSSSQLLTTKSSFDNNFDWGKSPTLLMKNSLG